MELVPQWESKVDLRNCWGIRWEAFGTVPFWEMLRSGMGVGLVRFSVHEQSLRKEFQFGT
jgi:hypothetical protein